MTHPFLRATSLQPAPDGAWQVTFDASWAQGRGVYGGVVSAVAANAIKAVVDPRRRLRTLSLSFCAPARPGAANIRTRLVREGAWVSTIGAEIENADGVVATALATCAAPRALEADVVAAAHVRRSSCPDVPAPETVTPVAVDLPLLPVYARHLELRFAFGDPPGTGGQPRVGAWIRFREPGIATADEAVAVAFLDALPPALLSTLPSMRPAASVEWHVQFFAGLPRHLAAGEDLLVTAETWMAEEGYAEERDQLWTKDGALLAQAHQTIALL